MNRHSWLGGAAPCGRRWAWLLVIVVGCADRGSPPGGGGPDGGSPGPTIVRVEVSPGALLLTGPGQTHGLSAKAFDAQGAEVSTGFVWSSSRPAEVTVDSAGRVSAVALGSAQVTAQADGVSSPAVVVLVAETAPGAVLVTDAQLVSVGPVVSDPSVGPGVGTQYEVRLRSVSPAPAAGTILLAAESAPVAGKVVSTRDESGTLVVTLELRPLYEVLRRYHIDWDLEVAPYAAEDLLVRSGPPDGIPDAGEARSPALTGPSPGVSLRALTAVECEGIGEASFFKKTISLAPSTTLRWLVQDSREDPNQAPTYVKHALVGEFALVGTVEFGLNAGVSVGGTCLAQLPPIRFPVLGVASVLVMPQIRLGAGVDLSVGLEVARGAIGLTGKVGMQAEIGWECGPPPLPCRGLKNLTEIKEVTPKFEVPSIHQMKVKLDAQLFAQVRLELAALGGLVGSFVVAEGRIGPKQSARLGFEDDQAQTAESSSYDLKLSGSIAPGADLQTAIKKVISDDTVSVDLSWEKPLLDISESPKGTLTVSKESAAINEEVKFTVDITAGTQNYIGIDYNVVSIQIWRKPPGEDAPFEHFDELDIFPTASGQLRYEKVWKPKAEHMGRNEFVAFVHTEVHDTGLLPLLEVADDTRKKVDVQAICAPQARRSRGPVDLVAQQQSGGCQAQGTLRHLKVTNSDVSHFEYEGQATVNFTQDPDLLYPVIAFRPEGTCSFRYNGNVNDCIHSATSTGCSLEDAPSLVVFVDTSGDQPIYQYLANVKSEPMIHGTVTCPDATPINFDIATGDNLMKVPYDEVWVADGGVVKGTRTETTVTNGETVTDTWTWDLTLEIPPPH